jgi:hypothetical protein
MATFDLQHLAQGFIQQYGVKSLLGFGNTFMSEKFYIVLAFTRVPISKESAETFAELAAFIGTLLS